MGFEPFGFAGGRVDVWAPEEDVYWGPEAEAMASERYGNPHRSAELEKPLGAVQMGLIYVRKTPPSHSVLHSILKDRCAMPRSTLKDPMATLTHWPPRWTFETPSHVWP
jgi:hypothetical protein